MLSRRSLGLALAACVARPALAVAPSQAAGGLAFPRDFGAHPQTRMEWWYLTGSLASATRPCGFQLTFFRAATGIAGEPGRFSPAQLVFAHAAVSDLRDKRLRRDQHIARAGAGRTEAASADTSLRLQDWQLVRESAPGLSRYRASATSATGGFRFELELQATQPLLLQGDDGVSRKGPDAAQSSRYYSEPQLAVRGSLALDGAAPASVAGRAWLDHEWSDSFLDASAVGWDWIGMNLDDGAALTAFRLRRGDGSTLWGGGTFRASASAPVRNFAANEVVFTAGRAWISPASKASYPVAWSVSTPAGRFEVEALLDDQELDSRASTGAIYWEGLSRLRDASGREVGRGYLEMTGYAARLVL